MKVQTKSMILLFLLTIVFVGLFFWAKTVERNRLLLLIDNEKNEKGFIFDRIVELKGIPLETFVVDYTFWDDMVNFVKSKNMQWAEDNLADGLNTFNVNAIWVYDINLEPAYSINNLEDNGLAKISLPGKTLKNLLNSGRFYHFFLYTSGGLMEFRGASIHSTTDVQRKTAPQGYFFAGKLWDETYFNELGRLTRSTIQVIPLAKLSKEDTGLQSPSRKSGIVFSRTLNDAEGNPYVRLSITSGSKILQLFRSMAAQNLLFLMIFSASIVVVLFIFLYTNITSPLLAIVMALKTEKGSFLDKLPKDRSEFGAIAGLMRTFFNHKQILLNEIGERKRAEETALRNERRFSDIAESTGDWIWEVDGQSRYIYSSPVIEEILGYKAEEVLGKYFYDFFPPEDRERLKNETSGILSGQNPFKNFISRKVHKDGHAVILEASGVAIIGSAGELLGYRGVARDITERKQAEAELKDSQERLKILFEHAPDTTFLCDLKGVFSEVNRKAEELSGYKREELIGKNIFKLDVLPAGQLAKAEALLSKVASGSPVGPEEIVINRKDGRQVIVELRAFPVKVSGEEFVLGSLREVTEEKQLEEELKKKMESLERFNRLTVGRELKMAELKNKIKELEERIGAAGL